MFLPHSNYDRSSKARFLSKGGDPKKFTYSFPYSIGSLEKLEKSAKGLGSISFLIKPMVLFVLFL